MDAVDQILGDPGIDDLAADFIETVVGSFDWKANWADTPDKVMRIQRWLKQRRSTANPEAVIQAIDHMVSRGGQWQGTVI